MTKRIGIVAVFLVGCAVGGVSGQLAVPKASAQQAATLTKWEYLCVDGIDSKRWLETAKPAGDQGWELTTTQLGNGFIFACFKRPKM